MERSNLYFLSLAFLLLATSVALISLNESHLSVYIGFFAMEYFVCVLIYRPQGQAFLLISATLLILWAVTAGLTVVGLGF